MPMEPPKYVSVLIVRLMKDHSIVAVAGQAQIMLDPSVPRDLMLAILKHVIQVIEAGRSPEQIAALKF